MKVIQRAEKGCLLGLGEELRTTTNLIIQHIFVHIRASRRPADFRAIIWFHIVMRKRPRVNLGTHQRSKPVFTVIIAELCI